VLVKAAVVTDATQPLQLQDRPVPEAGAGQVLVRVEVSGACRTDLHAARGDWPVRPAPPFVPGHEGIGVVTQVGPGVRSRQVGARVAVPWLGHACGRCDLCTGGREFLCEQQRNTGFTLDGTFAEYVVAEADFVVEVPQGVPSRVAAPLTCAGVTAYRAVRVARIRPSTRVGVFGAGGLGHLAVQYARLAGGIVAAVDVDRDDLDLVRRLGASQVVDATRSDPVAELGRRGGLDVAVVTSAAPAAFEQALAALRRDGCLVCVGLPRETASPVCLPVFDTVWGGRTVIGSVRGTRRDLADVLRLHAEGRTQVVTQIRPFDEVNAALDDLEADRVRGELVLAVSRSEIARDARSAGRWARCD
jgi:propanol-preferring alcohol dehydrogenase